ncbi:MAG TPA: hypothetical protein ENI26_00480 [Methylophaga aminisulfidivorans]|uniref:Tetratricopeptide repeat protein n=2 Tax=root TaxID=1 RepID=A0A7C2A5D6_9GAMM|nr:hypothetical protein [Methylophaga aminisulfidivorans]
MASHHSLSIALIQQQDWQSAHQLIQQHDDMLSCMIHGYLHLLEGDKNNATYWYNRADQLLPVGSMEDELARLSKLSEAEAN